MANITIIKSSQIVAENRFSAEFFDSKYSFKPLNADAWVRIGRILKKCQYGISISMNEYGKGFPIFRMNELENCFALHPEKYADISNKEFSIFELKQKDILFNRTNSFDYVGRTGLYLNEGGDVFASYLIRLVPDDAVILPEYLTVYLNTKFGIGQIKRRAMRSINQANVSASEIKKVLIYRASLEFQKEISDMLNKSFIKKNLANQIYSQAQEILKKELGLDQLVLEKPKSYETSFSEVVSGGRIDSDYFQVQFKQQANHLNMIQSKPLRELVYFQKGIEVGSPAYTESGKLFVRVSNVKKTGVVTGSSDKYISETLFNCLESYQPKIGDILLTKDGTVGVCYVVDEPVDGIISGGIMKLSKKNESIPSEYLALVINSPICQFQIDRDCSGALIVHWKPKDIAALKIPILAEDKMAELSDLVNQSKIAKKESEQLLDQAKIMVEELIEGAI